MRKKHVTWGRFIELEVLEKHILVNILEMPVAIVSNIYQTANWQNEAQALALRGHEAELHNYSLEFWLLRILK